MLLLFTIFAFMHIYHNALWDKPSPETGQLDLPTSHYFLLSQEQQEAGQ